MNNFWVQCVHMWIFYTNWGKIIIQISFIIPQSSQIRQANQTRSKTSPVRVEYNSSLGDEVINKLPNVGR